MRPVILSGMFRCLGSVFDMLDILVKHRRSDLVADHFMLPSLRVVSSTKKRVTCIERWEDQATKPMEGSQGARRNHRTARLRDAVGQDSEGQSHLRWTIHLVGDSSWLMLVFVKDNWFWSTSMIDPCLSVFKSETFSPGPASLHRQPLESCRRFGRGGRVGRTGGGG